MAQSGKANMKQMASKKSPEGGGSGGKKKNKQKKSSSEHLGDGAPSSALASSNKLSEAATPVKLNEGAKASVDKKIPQNALNEIKDKSKHQSVEVSDIVSGIEKLNVLPKNASDAPASEAKVKEDAQNKAEADKPDKAKKETKEENTKLPDVSGKKKENKKEVGGGESALAPSGETKSKSQLRAERRATQEAQRAAKEAKKSEGGPSASVNSSASATKSVAASAVKSLATTKVVVASSEKPKAAPVQSSSDKQKLEDTSKKVVAKKVADTETEEQMWSRMEKEIMGKSLKIDNRVLNLGFQYFYHKIVGANARCLAMLITFREVIGGYKTPEEKDLSRDLEKSLLNPCIKYLNYCRPISISMGNAIKYLKYHISKIPSNMEDEAAISKLQKLIDEFITEKIIGASKTIAEYSKAKINNNDVILIYAGSSLIARVLKDAHKAGKKFRVIVVEGRPRTEGKTMLRFLVRCGIPCSYIYIGSAVYAMSEVTKVFLGAAAMFATGDMYSRSGNSMIAALARANNIPVLVCCETYKFSDKVQLHTGDSNLHARSHDLISVGQRPQILGNYEELGLRLLNIMYDVTGSKYITCLITEQGLILPATIPAILRRHEDLLEETSGK
ncbi:translation initiation factor eIF-2B subunit delta [Biomphalaria glabrata]|uniref:Translation initiation factor eIF2B subunit delta n=1 Tax=Biomphalaria glabrata TaxID=6526 RepID=A0A9W2Z8T3_BIOGL|nr:translation initiation factor eIF-2B subunit delta-like [Biomphalaria glabrata]XP_055871323.1 translation initiation factor eIF-2B subunit delta-like [Biomphalaria glabrata]XP_055871324.1 translation initiation factor eIF-2B subunit delta-like [Biomphalaria glabrata]XP_055871325.1 translation initiation factor eIF-2B subunit delta-like [Biomphalaria glabrata]XP_055871326.1 translation initiation factor eIF-2B subunit delta-like [Biomphalaria glabrata]